MKTVCVYHNNCFDGSCAAWVVHRMFPAAKFIPGNYGDRDLINGLFALLGNMQKEFPTRLVLVDFSFPRETMMEFNRCVEEMIVIDHHKTAQKDCEGLEFCVFNLEESGASLAWKYYFKDEPLPTLVRYIRDRDLWLFKEPYSEEVNAFIQSFPMNIGTYQNLSEALEDPIGYETAVTAGQAIVRYKNELVKRICDSASILAGIPVVNTSVLFSEVGHELCKRFPNAPYSAYYFDRLNDNTRQYGLRSIGEYDVSNVARNFGGGGHRNAAGFTTTVPLVLPGLLQAEDAAHKKDTIQ